MKVAEFTPATLLKKHPLQVFFKGNSPKVQKNYISELHTKQRFVGHLVLHRIKEYHSNTAPKAKYEIAILNSVKYHCSYEQMPLILDFPTRIIF